MLTLKRPFVTPPGGYKYLDPDLNVLTEASTFDSLVRKVRDLHKANDLAQIPNLDLVIMDSICRKLPAELVKTLPVAGAEPGGGDPRTSHDGPSSRRRLAVTESVSLRATTALLRLRPALIPWELALPRASICVSCPDNTAEPCCYSCRLMSVFATYVGKIRYRTGSDLHKAGVCGRDMTFTKATIRVGDLSAFRSMSDEGYPEHCWKQNKEL